MHREEYDALRATLKIVKKDELPHWIVVGAGIAGLRAALTLAVVLATSAILKFTWFDYLSVREERFQAPAVEKP